MADKTIPASHLGTRQGGAAMFVEVYAFETAPGSVDFRMGCNGVQLGFTVTSDFARQLAAALLAQATAAEAIAAAQEVAA